ncbi:hypothetical protein PPERSA_11511 [Pseudocohnilembus persalinus]|uniref:Uncharacterized protein n=1 Tax=Pseudocohnilembus persalinus TaxID=266149 RepID=A0A0V0QX97_PSEPJ|nr:hypothetical protein PPERSA_11511 [Pseudocohnilembus persalinus]|eukprot:KRX06866.1 hypothetical protein PPERSA_11511 [Pseudocohnilembus persalinus]
MENDILKVIQIIQQLVQDQNQKLLLGKIFYLQENKEENQDTHQQKEIQRVSYLCQNLLYQMGIELKIINKQSIKYKSNPFGSLKSLGLTQLSDEYQNFTLISEKSLQYREKQQNNAQNTQNGINQGSNKNQYNGINYQVFQKQKVQQQQQQQNQINSPLANQQQQSVQGKTYFQQQYSKISQDQQWQKAKEKLENEKKQLKSKAKSIVADVQGKISQFQGFGKMLGGFNMTPTTNGPLWSKWVENTSLEV